MQKAEIRELLIRHSQVNSSEYQKSSLDLCVYYWVPKGKSLEWYLGFFQCLEILRGIRELFCPGLQGEAYRVISEKIRSELEKFAAEKE